MSGCAEARIAFSQCAHVLDKFANAKLLAGYIPVAGCVAQIQRLWSPLLVVLHHSATQLCQAAHAADTEKASAV